jgi:hypothetical protein
MTDPKAYFEADHVLYTMKLDADTEMLESVCGEQQEPRVYDFDRSVAARRRS